VFLALPIVILYHYSILFFWAFSTLGDLDAPIVFLSASTAIRHRHPPGPSHSPSPSPSSTSFPGLGYSFRTSSRRRRSHATHDKRNRWAPHWLRSLFFFPLSCRSGLNIRLFSVLLLAFRCLAVHSISSDIPRIFLLIVVCAGVAPSEIVQNGRSPYPPLRAIPTLGDGHCPAIDAHTFRCHHGIVV